VSASHSARIVDVVPRRVDSQPAVGLVGAGIALALVMLLGVVVAPPTSLQVLGAVTTYSLPVLIASALWWRGWPARGLPRLLAGAVNTAVIVALALALTALGQAIVGHADLTHLLDTTPAQQGPPPAGVRPAAPPFPSYPWTLPLAGLVFLVMVLLTFVCDRWPLRALGDVGSGFAALLAAWAAGLIGYLLVADWNPVVPPPAQHLLGLSNPGGPVSAFTLLGWTLCVAVWAVVLFIPLRGRPFAGLSATAARVAAGNAVSIAGGWLSFIVLRDAAGFTVPEIAAGCGSVIAASLVAAIVFEGWPARLAATPGVAAAAMLATVAVVAAALYVALEAIGEARASWTPANPVELWMTVCTLNFIGAGSILWYGVWQRWPAAPPAHSPDPSSSAP
jgi:hypothetical protein